MDRYIGIDVHQSSCTCAVQSARGKLLRTDTIATHADSLREYLKLIPGTKHVAIEEGTQAQWLYEVLLVLNVNKSTGNKSD